MGRELVADSFTKVVNVFAFERAVQDLCIKSCDSEMEHVSGGGVRQDHVKAKIAMLVGASLLSGASANEESDGDDELSWFWTIGLILMCVGAVYTCSKVIRSGIWLYQRLQGTSGGCIEDRADDGGETPHVRMLRIDSSDEERLVRRSRLNDEQARYTPAVDMDELQDMVTRSRQIENDPHNKMHGRVPEDWHQEDSSQMPRRRKKKVQDKKQLSLEEEEAMLEHARRNLLRMAPIRNVPDSSSAWRRERPSGFSNNAASSASSGACKSGYGELTGSENLAGATRMQSSTRSGSATGAAAERADPVVNAPTKRSTQSGSSSAAAAGATSSMSSSTSGSSNAVAERVQMSGSTNAWNEFQHAYQGRHWGSEKLRAEYWKFKATGKRPP